MSSVWGVIFFLIAIVWVPFKIIYIHIYMNVHCLKISTTKHMKMIQRKNIIKYNDVMHELA